MLDKSICHFSGVGPILSFLCCFFLRKLLSPNTEDPDQTPHYVASYLGLHGLPMPITLGKVNA